MNKPQSKGAQQHPTVQPALTVLNAITADLFKAQIGGLAYYDATLGKTWDLNNDTAIDFVKVIESKFARNNKFHGYFAAGDRHMAPRNLLRFISEEISFVEMANAFVENACREANVPHRGSLTLGHLVMVHYKTMNEPDDVGRLLAVLVGKQEGYDFNSDLQPVDLTSINTSELRHAAMFDLTLFKESYPENDGDPYLKFITGKSRSGFFKDAFGCSDHIPNRDSVEQVNTAVLNFLDDPAIPSKRRLLIIEKVTSHLSIAAKNNTAVSIRNIEQVINKELPLGSNKIDGFSDYVNIGGYTISERFQPTRASAQLLQSVEISDPGMGFKCSVNLDAIGYADSSDKTSIIVDDALTTISLPLTPRAKSIIEQILGKKDEPDLPPSDQSAKHPT